jgi:hypothetical protein
MIRKHFLATLNEEKLIELLKTNMVPDFQKTDETNNKDGYSPKTDVVFEFKCRTDHYDELFIEYNKYNHLMKYDRARYIVSTPEGIYSFNIKNLPEPLWYDIELMTSKWFFRNATHTIRKMGNLHIKDSKNITNLLLKGLVFKN